MGVIGNMISDNATVGRITVVAKDKVETRSQRVNLVVRPSILKKAKAKCKAEGIKSLNDCINQMLEAWVDE